MKMFLKTVLAVMVGGILLILLPIILIALFGSVGSDSSESIPENARLYIDLTQPLIENQNEIELSALQLKGPKSTNLLETLQAIHAAKTDDNIKGIVIKMGITNASYAQLNEIRTALQDFKKAKKSIKAFGENASQKDYYLGTVADSIFIAPLGRVELKGLNAEVLFYKNMLDKIGVEFSIVKHGKYKSAVEPYFRNEMSDESKFQTQELLNDIWGNISKEMAESRKIDLVKFNQLSDSLVGLVTSQAISSKLIDGSIQYTEFLSRSNIKEEQLISPELLMKNHSQDFSANQIAVLNASGEIISGNGASAIQDDYLISQIRKIKEDESIKGVVLRINSPGGSASASEKILYELRLLHAKKPIVVSFSSVAASGGYYIAGASDHIMANPNTITGSIGVFGAIPSAKGLIEKLGLNVEEVQTNANATILSLDEKPNSQFLQKMTESIEETYALFVSNVSKNRKMTPAQVDSIGQGRVWSGVQAKKVGLIDSFGGIEDAIKMAAQKAKITAYNIVTYPIIKSDIDMLLDRFGGEKEMNLELILKQKLGPELYSAYAEYKYFTNPEKIHMKLPCKIIIQ